MCCLKACDEWIISWRHFLLVFLHGAAASREQWSREENDTFLLFPGFRAAALNPGRMSRCDAASIDVSTAPPSGLEGWQRTNCRCFAFFIQMERWSCSCTRLMEWLFGWGCWTGDCRFWRWLSAWDDCRLCQREQPLPSARVCVRRAVWWRFPVLVSSVLFSPLAFLSLQLQKKKKN